MVETQFTGAHLFHLAAAGCVLNDVYREANNLNLPGSKEFWKRFWNRVAFVPLTN